VAKAPVFIDDLHFSERISRGPETPHTGTNTSMEFGQNELGESPIPTSANSRFFILANCHAIFTAGPSD
jgi:hypothetical protein